MDAFNTSYTMYWGARCIDYHVARVLRTAYTLLIHNYLKITRTGLI